MAFFSVWGSNKSSCCSHQYEVIRQLHLASLAMQSDVVYFLRICFMVGGAALGFAAKTPLGL